jgi:hypothetical protein
MGENINSTSGNQVVTPEAIFVGMYTNALQNLQSTWMGTKFNKEAFALQINYLINMIPDEQKRVTICKKIQEAEKDIKAGKWGNQAKNNIEENACLYVVSSLVDFVCSSFNLLHIDINGPATSKQYREAMLEIPDIEEENNSDETD